MGPVTGRRDPNGIVINGRFLCRAPTGVDRVAERVLIELDRYLDTDCFANVTLALPERGARPLPLKNITIERGGRLPGLLWEQIDLPLLAGQRVLMNFCNTAPAIHARNIVVMHDALIYDWPVSYTPAFRIWYKALLPWLARRALRVITVSGNAASRLADHGVIADASKAIVIHNGADHLGAPAEAAAGARAAPRPFVLFVGSHAPHKNLALFYELASVFVEQLDFVVVGASNARIFDGSKTLAPPANVAFRGRVTDEELKHYYKTALCLVFPSWVEGFGLPPLEAMAAGCPVVSSNHAAMREVLGPAPLYADPADKQAWMSAIQRLSADSALRDALAESGRTRAANYRWDKTSKAYAGVLKQALADRNGFSSAPDGARISGRGAGSP